MRKKPVLFFFLFIILLFQLPAQTTPTNPAMTSSQFITSDFPQWAKDLRRAEIVAFGSFPFMYFFSNFGVGLYRWADHGDRRYAPWPFDSAGSVPKTDTEMYITLGIAAGSSVLIAIIDYSIERYKRNKKEREYRSIPEGSPIIIRTPLFTEEAEDPDSEPVPLLVPEADETGSP